MAEIKKIELTRQQLWDAGFDKIRYWDCAKTYDCYVNGELKACLSKESFIIANLPESGVAKKSVDKSSWIGEPCWFWDDGDCSFEVLDILDAIDATEEKVYLSRGFGCWFKHCKPATKEEVLEWFTKNGGKE